MKQQITIPQECIPRLGIKKAREFYDLVKDINYNRKSDGKEPISFEPIPDTDNDAKAGSDDSPKPPSKPTSKKKPTKSSGK